MKSSRLSSSLRMAVAMIIPPHSDGSRGLTRSILIRETDLLHPRPRLVGVLYELGIGKKLLLQLLVNFHKLLPPSIAFRLPTPCGRCLRRHRCYSSAHSRLPQTHRANNTTSSNTTASRRKNKRPRLTLNPTGWRRVGQGAIDRLMDRSKARGGRRIAKKS